MGPAPCEWVYDQEEDAWDTDCGNKFQVTVDTPRHNGMKFCPYCGGELAQAGWESEQ